MYPDNNIWLPDQRLVLALPRKAACTSIKRMLLEALGYDQQMGVHELQRPGWLEIGVDDTPEDAEMIGVLRDPVTRAWSGWCQVDNRSQADDSAPAAFEAFLRHAAPASDAERDPHIASQLSYLRTSAGRLPSSWLYVEHLARDWAALCARKGWAIPTALPHDNARVAYSPAWVTRAALRLIQQGWAEDVVLFTTQWPSREGLRSLYV